MAELPHDRRRSFRVDDEIRLDLRILREDEYALLMQQTGVCADSLQGQLHALTQQASGLLVIIRKSHPDIAQYLALLDHKLELLAGRIEATNTGGELQPDTHVNVSAHGIAFWHDAQLTTGTKLELHLVFFPSYLRIRVLARVVHSEYDPQPDGKNYRVGVEYTKIAEQDQEALMRHLIERQSALLRQQKGH